MPYLRSNHPTERYMNTFKCRNNFTITDASRIRCHKTKSTIARAVYAIPACDCMVETYQLPDTGLMESLKTTAFNGLVRTTVQKVYRGPT